MTSFGVGPFPLSRGPDLHAGREGLDLVKFPSCIHVPRSAVGLANEVVVYIIHDNLHVCVITLTGAHALRSNEQWYMTSLT